MSALAESADRWTMRETKHINGGKEWFGYVHQCIQQPRLTRLDRYLRKDRSVVSEWRVDGEKCATFEDALAELESGPALTIAEMDAVAAFTSVEMGKGDFADFDAVYEALRILDSKGLVWWEAGRVRLLIDALKPALDSAESNASGNPQWEYVSPRVKAARTVLATLAPQGDVQ